MLGKAATHIHSKGIKWIIGNVHPRNTLINSDGELKVVTLNSIPYEQDHYEVYKLNGIHSAYIRYIILIFQPRTYGIYLREVVRNFPTVHQQTKIGDLHYWLDSAVDGMLDTGYE